ncbi:MAG: hypothetical protein IJB65_00880 [Clostridia bacterium]|nr:hypothetical protein [Clostridia bacterium]
MDYEITVLPPLSELVLQEAAEREVSAEEIITEAIKNYMEKSENIG